MLKNLFIYCLLICSFVLTTQKTLALSYSEQITSTNVNNYSSFIVLKSRSADEIGKGMKRIQIFITPKNSSGVNNVSGILSLRSEGKLLALCVVRSHVPDLESKRIEKALKKNTVIVEFYIASDSIASSKCAINIMDPDGSGFSEYWFYIGDLCKK